MRFENHGQALKFLAKELDARTKTRLTLQFLCNSNTPVARLIATTDFVDITDDTKTLEFYEHIGEFHTTNADLDEPMRIVMELLNQDMMDTGEMPIEEEEDSEEEEDEIEIDAKDSWDNVWSKMKELGWRKKITKSGNDCWVFPGASRSNGVHGEDYFNTMEELKDFVRREYGWSGSTNKTTTAGNKRKKDDDRIWGRPKKQATSTTVVSTPPNQKTKPQDPAAPRLDSSDDDDDESEHEEDQYNWKVLWNKLKAAGWTAVRAGRYNRLHDWYYVRPRRVVAEGEIGIDYFHTPSDVIDFVRYQDEQDLLAKKSSSSSSSSSVVMPSPRKRSRKFRADFKEQHQADVKTTSTTKVKSPSKKQTKKWWFHTEALPSYREVWNILHHKLDFRYSSGCYKLPTGDQVFATDLEMRCYLVEHGIPNIDRASEQDRKTLERWVAFVQVPVKDTNSTIKLAGMQELSSEEASDILVNLLGFRVEKNGSYHRGADESFASLEDARVYFRGAESLAPPVQGRRRSKEKEVTMSEDQVLEFRLWAALSRTPLPTFSSSQVNEGATTLTINEEEGSTNEVDLTANKEQKEDDSKENSAKRSSKKAVDMFEDDDYNDVPPCYWSSWRRNRVSMSPGHHALMMTQPEE